MSNDRYRNADEFRRRYKRDTKTQCEMTLEYMERYGSVTPLEALQAYGCLRLGARICDLRKAGYQIKTDRAADAMYAIYSL